LKEVLTTNYWCVPFPFTKKKQQTCHQNTKVRKLTKKIDDQSKIIDESYQTLQTLNQKKRKEK